MDIINRALNLIVNPLILLFMGLAMIYFLWGVLVFVKNADNAEKRPDGARHILWGIIGLAIMFSVFAITHMLYNTVVGQNSGTGPGQYPASLK